MEENVEDAASNAASAHAGVPTDDSTRTDESDNSDDMIAQQLIPGSTQSTVSAYKGKSYIRQTGVITPAEFRALAMFLVENPWVPGTPGYTAHFEKFRRSASDFNRHLWRYFNKPHPLQSPIGIRRPARSWKEACDRHPSKIKDLMKNFNPRMPEGKQYPL